MGTTQRRTYHSKVALISRYLSMLVELKVRTFIYCESDGQNEVASLSGRRSWELRNGSFQASPLR